MGLYLKFTIYGVFKADIQGSSETSNVQDIGLKSRLWIDVYDFRGNINEFQVEKWLLMRIYNFSKKIADNLVKIMTLGSSQDTELLEFVEEHRQRGENV